MSKNLLSDKPVKELGTGKILCYRKADERELEASRVMGELLSVIKCAKDDLEKYAVWSSRSIGFGQLTLYWGDDDRLHADTEMMGTDFARAVLKLLADELAIDQYGNE